MLTRLEAKTGVHCNPHKWRHSSAIQYLRNGGKVESLRAMLGHTTLTMTLHYARIAGVDLAAAHETADPARSLKVRV
jgi:integrase/recombinase XerD